MKKKYLLLFTNSFPYGKGEQYLENELPYYSNEFKRIIFVPVNLSGKKRTIPQNAEVLNIHPKVNYSKTKYISSFSKFNSLFRQEKKLKNKIGGSKIKHYKLFYNASVYAEAINNWLNEQSIERNQTVFYSYWFYHWVTVMSELRNLNYDGRYISRAHLYDAYDYLEYNYWGSKKLFSLDKLICISDHAKKYFNESYSQNLDKIQTLRLGVANQELSLFGKGKDKFTLVSCSSIRADKRLDFILEVLKNISLKIKWIHFGDGPLKADIENRIKNLPENVEAELKGFTPNSELLNYYKNNQIDLFINLSLREGISVSLMEAISFGIPVLGTNIFGTTEIVTNKTGILVDLDDSAQAVADKIINHINTGMRREEIRKFQQEYFSAEKNYSEFRKILLDE